MPGEEAIYGQIQSLLDAAAKDPHIRDLLKQTAIQVDQNLIKPLFQFVNVGYPVKYNWSTQRNGAQFGLDYLTRTACAKANIFVNKPNETKYFYQDRDSSGVRLNGNNKYSVTFTKEGDATGERFLVAYAKELTPFFRAKSVKTLFIGELKK